MICKCFAIECLEWSHLWGLLAVVALTLIGIWIKERK